MMSDGLFRAAHFHNPGIIKLQDQERIEIMKQIRKFLTLFLMLAVMTVLPAMQSSAADHTPGRVRKLTATKISETSIRLNWPKATKADGYIIYQVDQKTGELERVGKTRNLAYTFKDMKPGQKYTYQVFTYRVYKEKTYKDTKGSPLASVKLTLKKPAKVSNFRVSSYGDGTVTLSWNKSANATSYVLYQYDTDKKKYVRIAITNNLTYTVKKLERGVKYRFQVVARRTVNKVYRESDVSDTVAFTGVVYSESTKAVKSRRHEATVKINTTATVVATKKTITLKKGTKVATTARSGGMVTAFMTNGTKIRMQGSKLTYGNLRTNTKEAYSKDVKETFINEKGYASRTNYLIWISQYTLQVSVFKGSQGNWKMVRSMPCVVGRNGKTPTGVFRIANYYDWAYGGPRLYFTLRWVNGGPYGNSFHNRTDGTTRAAASNGCVRLASSDLYFIYNNCKAGTTVLSY